MYRDKVQQDVAKFYFSSAGRVFSRREVTHKYGNGQELSVNAVDHHSSGQVAYYSQISFTGQAMQAVRSIGNADGIRLIVQFDPSFSSCKASAHFVRAAGTSTFIDPFSKRRLEVVSMGIDQASCKVQVGNIFE